MAKVVNNSRICKATIFVGLNDKESKLQEISTLEAAADFQAAGVEFDGGKAYQIRKAGRGVVVEYRYNNN